MRLSPDILHPASNPIPHFAAASAIRVRETPLLLNFPPPLLRRPTSSKRGAAGIERPLKAKHALVPVMMGAAAAQNYTFSTSTFSGRSFDQLGSNDARSGIFGLLINGCACDAVQLTAQRV